MTKPSNPNRSGGPKTAQGIMVASGNSLKTGTFSKLVVLPGEDESEFRRIEEHLLADFQPVGIVEEAMVHELAGIYWKKLRLEKIDHERWQSVLNKPCQPYEMKQQGYALREEFEWILDDPTVLNDVHMQVYEENLKFFQRLADGIAELEDIETLRMVFPELYEDLLVEASANRWVDLSPTSLRDFQIQDEKGNQVYMTQYVAKREIPYLDNLINLCERREVLNEAIRRVTTDRMLQIFRSNDLAGATLHLDRRFNSLLSELRKQKDWARKNPTMIDVTPNKTGDETE